MKDSTKIIINTMATYGQSVISLFVSLFSARWLLKGLGEVDLGLYYCIGGMIPFLSVLSATLQASTQRFYAYTIGEHSGYSKQGENESLKGWFNAAFTLQVLIPMFLVVIAYPVCIYAVNEWFVVPAERIEACEWVVRCSLLAALISMMSSPYLAMFIARQRITELAVFDTMRTVLYFISSYILLFAKCDRLVLFACLSCSYLCVIYFLQMIRAYMIFPECRVSLNLMCNIEKIRKLFGFSFWSLFSEIGNMCRRQGTGFMINRYLGAKVNAAYSISNHVSAQALSLSAALQRALMPAVTTAEGAKNRNQVILLANRSCKFTSLLIVLFSVPVCLELDKLLTLWLDNPPCHTKELCICTILAFVCLKMTEGYHLLLIAIGKIKLYQAVSGFTVILTLPVLNSFLKLKMGALAVGVTFVLVFVLMSIERLVLARVIARISIRFWISKVFLPMSCVCIISILAGILPIKLLSPSLIRILITSFTTGIVTIILGWFLLFDNTEKEYLIVLVRKMFNKCLAIIRPMESSL